MKSLFCLFFVTSFIYENRVNYNQKYILERHAPFIGEISAECICIAMRTASLDIFFTNDSLKNITKARASRLTEILNKKYYQGGDAAQHPK
jgi:hypothetical protein